MNSNRINIRTASPDDAEKLLAIYAPYVKNTAITFEYDVPGIDEFKNRIEETLKKYPYLIVEMDGEAAGYAYTGAFSGRAAYDRAAAVSIYVRQERRKMGLGKKLYAAIEEISRAQNITNLYACIGYPDREDEYLDRNSLDFHRHMGYKLAGEFHKCGYKFGRWYNVAWMEKMVGDHRDDPASLIWFPDLEREDREGK